MKRSQGVPRTPLPPPPPPPHWRPRNLPSLHLQQPREVDCTFRKHVVERGSHPALSWKWGGRDAGAHHAMPASWGINNAILTLGQSLRRWPSVKTAMKQLSQNPGSQHQTPVFICISHYARKTANCRLRGIYDGRPVWCAVRVVSLYSLPLTHHHPPPTTHFNLTSTNLPLI